MFKKLLNSKFKKDLSFSYITKAITVSFGFLQIFLINRYFGIATFGQLAIIMSTAGVFSSLLTARSSEAVTRFFKREELKQNYENAKFILFTGFSIDLVTAILLVGLIYFTSSFIATTFLKDIKLQNEIVLYSYITFFIFLKGTLFGYLQSKEMFVKMNVINIIESFIKIVMIISFVFIWDATNLDDIIYSFLAASIISLLYATYIFLTLYLKEYKDIKLVINKALLKEYWNFNFKTFFSSSLKAINQHADNLMIAYFLNNEIVGIYQLIKKILSPIMIISEPFSTLVYPKLIHFFETKQNQRFKNIIIKITLYIFMLSIFYMTLGYLFLGKILILMGVDFKPIYNSYYIIIGSIVVFTASLWWSRIFSNVLNPMYSIYSIIFGNVYLITISLLSIYYFGLIGFLCSILILRIFTNMYWFFLLNKYIIKFNFKEKEN